MATTSTTKQYEQTNNQSGRALLGSLLVKLHHSLHADISYVAKFHNPQNAQQETKEGITAHTIYYIEHGEPKENFRFSTSGTPAQEIVENKNCVISDSVGDHFPDDPFIQNNSISAFVGVPIRDHQGEPIGVIAVLYQEQLHATSRAISMLHKLSSQISELLIYPSASRSEVKQQTDESDSEESLSTWDFNVQESLGEWTDEIYRIFGIELDPNTDFLKNAEGESLKSSFAPALQQSPVSKLADSLEQTHARYLETIIDSLHDAIITVDKDGTILSANRTAESMYECGISDLVGYKVSSLMPEPYASLHKGFMENYLEDGVAKILGTPQELPALRKSGQEFPMEISISEVKQGDERIFIGIIRDISERKKAKDQIYELAYFDTLTQLPNRISFERDVLDVLARAKLAQGNVYCSLLNIDRFAQINLTYGKTTGDYVLKKITRRIQSVLTRSFKLYKNVADSFFLLYRAPITPGDPAVAREIKLLENSIQGAVASQLSLKGNPQNLTISMGSLHIQASEVDHYKLIRLLEFSEQKAKAMGQNSCFNLSNKEKALFERRTLISHTMVRGLDRGEFYIELQPQYSTTGEILSSEALIRWQSAELGYMPPGEFIHLAEKNGDIVVLGNWVINEACRLLAELKARNNSSKISINISGKQVMQPDFCQQLMYTLAEWKISANNFILEITESTLVKDVELVKERMEYLSEQGFSFSIDDFGTGYSSLIYLKELPIDELKIDRYFVDEIKSADEEVSIVNMIIEMAKALGIRTVAEGIETEEQLTYLMNKGCHFFQGFHLARPMPVADWLNLLTEPKDYISYTSDYEI